MIVWRDDAPDLKRGMPEWLHGCGNATSCGTLWYVAPPPYMPRGDIAWHKLSDGWSVGLCGDASINTLMRDVPWGCVLEVIDARKQAWIVPAILAPDGTPAVARVRRLVDGKWVREAADTLQSAAVEACISARSAALSHDEQTFALLSVLECTYHCNAETFGVLGLVDDVLVYQGLRAASGMIDVEGHGA